MDKMSYNTKQRDEIVEFFGRHRGGCFTAKDIIKSGEISVGEATVYRTLSKLANQGVLKRYTGDGAGASYQLNEGESCNSHFHLKCESCGRLIHMDCGFMADMKKHIESSHDFTVNIGKTVIYGLCGDCGSKGEEEK
ncbi:MAG: transcriptional repressor [Oscillospiraceae bacterium]|nr:transcriptional repressor [Oscillospiraceae bacterium]